MPLLLLLLALMPATIMTSQSWPSPVFYAAMAASLAVLARAPHDTIGALWRRYRGLFACMAAPALVALAAGLWHGRVSGADVEAGLRLAVGAALVTLALLARPDARAPQTLWGFALAALAAVATIAILAWPDGHRPDTSAIYNAVGYGNLTLLLAVLLALSLRLTLTRHGRGERLLRAALALATLAAFVLTQTRSGWVAMPVFALIAASLALPSTPPAQATAPSPARWRLWVLSVLIMGALAAVFLSNDTLRSRAVLAYDETLACRGAQATADTSICIRLQLWHAALQAGAQHPFAGLGDRRAFGPYLRDEALPRGVVSPFVAEGWGEPHNDVLLALASFGLPGALALLLAFLAPAAVFARRMARHHPAAVRTAAAMGLALCLGFLIFGLTETMLRGMRTTAYFALCCGLFLALSDPLRRPAPTASRALPGAKSAETSAP